MQPLLGAPGDGCNLRRQRALKLFLALAKLWLMPVVPSGLHEHASQMRVARLGDGAAPRLWSARVLGRHHARVAHHLAGFLEATEAAEFDCECDGRYFCDATQRLQGVDDRSTA